MNHCGCGVQAVDDNKMHSLAWSDQEAMVTYKLHQSGLSARLLDVALI